MSSLRFIKAPPRPDHINEVIWNSEWVGLFVGLASVFPQTIGYLGEGDARKFDEKHTCIVRRHHLKLWTT